MDMPAVREDHAAAKDGDGDAVALVKLLQLHLTRPLAAAVPARMRPQSYSTLPQHLDGAVLRPQTRDISTGLVLEASETHLYDNFVKFALKRDAALLAIRRSSGPRDALLYVAKTGKQEYSR